MENENQLAVIDKTVQQSVIAIQEENTNTMLVKVQKFQSLANKEPDKKGIDRTSDDKAETIVISFVETLLDELFFGQWSTENFKWSVISNEVQGSLELVVIHPITGREVRRTGAGSIIIQVDKVPDDLKNDSRAKNEWALNVANKKSNALDLGFPKLKTECLKNAAKSLGKAFGRDLNRKIVDSYNPLIPDETIKHEDLQALYDQKKEKMFEPDIINAERILTNKETNSYTKLHKQLISL